ncbi:hypothetical protein M9435_004483 [Picochlorum sp. BPE23]|nr:hypothetical protein M9435_004483 [Picochlorum sp. BPE23]
MRSQRALIYSILILLIASSGVLGQESETAESTVAFLGRAFRLRKFPDYNAEFALLGCALLLIVYSILGRKKNDGMATRYARQLLHQECPLVQQFEQVDGALQNTAPGRYSMYFTGRRNIKGCLVSFKMIPRHDMVSKVIIGARASDTLCVEIVLEDNATWSTVLLMAIPGAMKVITEEHADVRELTKVVNMNKGGSVAVGQWPSDNIHVRAEHSQVLHDILTPGLMSSFFGKDGGYSVVKQYFRSLHITDSYTYSSEKRVLRMVTDLPPLDDGEILYLIVQTALTLADAISFVKQSPDSLKKAKVARETWEAKKPSKVEERQRRLEEKRALKEAQDKEKLKRMTPQQREKEIARRQKIERGRRMKSMVKKM